jgi:hypothetical protein
MTVARTAQAGPSARPSTEGSILERAAALTSCIFAEAARLPLDYKGYEVVWSVYSSVHLKHSIPRELGQVEQENRAARSAVRSAGRWLVDASLFIYSLASLVRFSFRKGPKSILWSGDFYDARNEGDFRVGDLYGSLSGAGIAYLEFIRESAEGLGRTWGNAVKRRRPAFYYLSVCRILRPFGNRLPAPDLSGLTEGTREALGRFVPELSFIRDSLPWLERFLRFSGADALVAWELSSRQAGLIYAAKAAGMKVIGFMHGAGMKSYMAHEFMPEFSGKAPVGPDTYGVWSPWWKEYYLRNSRLYGSVEVSGTLRKAVFPPGLRKAGKAARPVVLWISEPLVPVEEVVGYIAQLSRRFRVVIKKRPSTTDIFYNALVARHPEFAALDTADGDIFAAIREADVVVGSHSTAVVDAALVGVPFVLVDTPKWGDYFELAGFPAPYKLFVTDAGELERSLDHVLAQDTEDVLGRVRDRFYGADADGCAWVVGKILEAAGK